ncbi:MAG: DUF481 domain-containing protein [Planctomycetota bacterium]|nr:MAG: DUF481 domain-containing protein [Planctomycetota bacterium]
MLLLALSSLLMPAVQQPSAVPALAPPPVEAMQDPPADPWSGSLAAGLTWITGNSESSTGTLDFAAKYDKQKYFCTAFANYSGVRQEDSATGDSTTTSRLYTAGASHNRYFSAARTWYAYANGAWRMDEPHGLQVRDSAGVGVGHSWKWDEDKSSFNAEAGPSYVIENLVALPSDSFASARVAEALDWAIGTDWKIINHGELLQSVDDTDDRSATADAGVRWTFASTWFAQATVAVAWDNTPAPGFEKTDWRYTVSLGSSF